MQGLLDWFQAPYPQLVIDGIKDLIDRKSQRGEVLFRSVGSEWIRRENREHLLLEGGLP